MLPMILILLAEFIVASVEAGASRVREFDCFCKNLSIKLGAPVRPPAITVFIVLAMLKVSKTNSGVKRCFKENVLCLDVKFIDLFFMVPLIYFS
jgi:hypothetical protein